MVQPHDELVIQYLAELRSFAGELTYAMECITSNEMALFAQSVGRQVAITDTLGGLTRRIEHSLPLSADRRAITASIARKADIENVCREVGELTTKYAALLNHSGKSIDRLLLLCESALGNLPGMARTDSNRQTWFCEA